VQVDGDDVVRHFRLAVHLWSERRAIAQRGTAETDKFLPHCVGEDRVLTADDRCENSMEADNLPKEGRNDGCGSVGVAHRDEVHVFGEPIDHGQDNRFPARLRESLDEVHGYVLPHRSGNVERLKDTGRVEVLSLMALANRAPANEVVDEAIVVRVKNVAHSR
jgi:hypothetical protein